MQAKRVAIGLAALAQLALAACGNVPPPTTRTSFAATGQAPSARALPQSSTATPHEGLTALLDAWEHDAVAGDCGNVGSLYPMTSARCAAAFPSIAEHQYVAFALVQQAPGGDALSGVQFVVRGERNDGQPPDTYAVNMVQSAGVWRISSVFQNLAAPTSG